MGGIDLVIARLGEIVAWARAAEQPAGYFAALYRTVTEQVANGIATGRFENGARMEQLDVVFAERYLTAFDAWRAGSPTTQAWTAAFAETSRWRPIVLQHLLGGMNAHINLDLGIAAASVAPGAALPSLRRDFDEINEILAGLVQQTKDELARIWPPLRLIDRISGPAEDAVVDFSMRLARDGAWRLAERLAPLRPEDWAAPIEERDRATGTWVADAVYRPGMLASSLLLVVRVGERGSTSRKIDTLAGAASRAVSAPRPSGPPRTSGRASADRQRRDQGASSEP